MNKPFSVRLDDKAEEALETIANYLENEVMFIKPTKSDVIRMSLIQYANQIQKEGTK
jgi:predicted transcriptional regulator